MKSLDGIVHGFLIAIIAGFGTVFLLPGDTLTLVPYSAFRTVASEKTWAWCLDGIAAWAAFGLLTGRRHCVLASLALIATTHGILALCFYFSVPSGWPPTTGVTTYGFIAIMGYLVFWRRWRIGA